MQCISHTLQMGFSTKEDVQYFFKQCFGRILKDFEAFAAAAWPDPVGLEQGSPYLQDKEQQWLVQFTSLIRERVKPITAFSASLKAIVDMHMHYLKLDCLP